MLILSNLTNYNGYRGGHSEDLEDVLGNFLLNIETELNIEHCDPEFLGIWFRLRQIVSDYIIDMMISKERDDKLESNKNILVSPSQKKRFNFRSSVLRSLIFLNPFLTIKRNKILIFTNSRRVIDSSDGCFEDLYTEPLYKYIGDNEAFLIEEPWFNNHFTPIRYKVKHGDGLLYLSYFFGILSYRPLRKDTLAKIRFIEDEIATTFSIDINIRKFAKRTWLKRKGALQAYKLLFLWLKPRLIIYTALNTDPSIVEAAKCMGFPVAELQHGILGQHVSFDNRAFRETQSDYLLIFGRFWSDEQAKIRRREVVVGFEYLNEKRKLYPLNKEKQIFIISDGNVEMSKLAVKLAKHHLDYKVVFKLKPTEFLNWEVKYPDLYRNQLLGDIEVVNSSDVSNYELLSRSEYQVGGCSMLLFEGIAFGCKTVVIRGSGFRYLKGLISKGYAISGDYSGSFDLSSAPEIDTAEIEHLFDSNTPLNFSNFLKNLK